MERPQASVGRAVHFYRPGTPATVPLAATIAEVPTDPELLERGEVMLFVLDPVAGVRFERALCSGETPTPGRWCWPPYGGIRSAEPVPGTGSEKKPDAAPVAVVAPSLLKPAETLAPATAPESKPAEKK